MCTVHTHMFLCGMFMAAGQRDRGCMPPSVQQRLLLALGVAGSSICCIFWLAAHVLVVTKFGWALGPRWVAACSQPSVLPAVHSNLKS